MSDNKQVIPTFVPNARIRLYGTVNLMAGLESCFEVSYALRPFFSNYRACGPSKLLRSQRSLLEVGNLMSSFCVVVAVDIRAV